MSELLFLTGLPRTGTTWVYQALAAGSGSARVYEPFNFKWHPERGQYHMRYLAPGSDQPEFLAALEEELGSVPGPRRFIKEVHACLAVEFVWDNLRPHTVILVRHPCAMAASWRRLGFEAGPRLRILLDQPAVVDEFLAPHLERLRAPMDALQAIGAYWGAAYHCLRRISDRHPEWRWVTHEDLCTEMQPAFAGLLAGFGIEWEEAGSRYLEEHNAHPETYQPHQQVRLNTEAAERWREELTVEEAEAVLAGARGFGLMERYYPEG